MLQCICILVLILSKRRPDEDPTWSKHVAGWVIYTVVLDGCLFISCFREHDTFGASGIYWEEGNFVWIGGCGVWEKLTVDWRIL